MCKESRKKRNIEKIGVVVEREREKEKERKRERWTVMKEKVK